MVANLTTRLGQLTSTPAGGPYTGKNRIINGNMAIDQRNAGASFTPASDSLYTVDRWVARMTQASKFSVQQVAGSTLASLGCPISLLITSLSPYSLGGTDFFAIDQPIESNNLQDLEYGNAAAKSVTISFPFQASITGTYGFVLINSTASYSYPFSYAVTANTPTLVTATIPGDTAHAIGTGTTEGLRLRVSFGAGATGSAAAGSWQASNIRSVTGAVQLVATNAATMYFGNVQLEVGTIATPYEFNQYQAQLAQCQRYYYRLTSSSGFIVTPFFGYVETANTSSLGGGQHPVTMRGDPTMVFSSVSFYSPVGTGVFAALGTNRSSTTTLAAYVNMSGTSTIGTGCALYFPAANAGYISLDAEL